MNDRCPTCNCEICKCDRYPHLDPVRAKKTIEQLKDQLFRYRQALTEIRDVASVSEGVEFYAMLADKALREDA